MISGSTVIALRLLFGHDLRASAFRVCQSVMTFLRIVISLYLFV